MPASDANVPAHGLFSPEERAESSTHRDLRGLLGCLRAFLADCRGRAVCLQVDNQNVDRVTRNGSSRPGLAALAKDIFSLCRSEAITMSVRWVPRELNSEADDLSKLSDTDDWRLNPRMFAVLPQLWGPCSVDAFATAENTHCPRFFSKWHSPGSAGIDAFEQPWQGESLWLNPPFGAIGAVLAKLLREQATGTLIVPEWRGRFWWPVLFPDGCTPVEFVVGVRRLPSTQDLFVSGSAGGSSPPSRPPQWRVLALRIKGRRHRS